VRHDVEAELLHLLDLVLPGRDDDRHVHGLEPAEPLDERGALLLRLVVGDGPPHARLLGLPLAPDLLVGTERRRLIDGDDHRLPLEPAPEEVLHDVLRDGVEPVVSRDEVVALAEELLETRLALLVEIRAVDDVVDVLVEGWIRQPQLGGAVLVEERNGRSILDRLLEVVDAHVVAEDLAGALLARDERRARDLRIRR
jgi:hypothetical protein